MVSYENYIAAAVGVSTVALAYQYDTGLKLLWPETKFVEKGK